MLYERAPLLGLRSLVERTSFGHRHRCSSSYREDHMFVSRRCTIAQQTQPLQAVLGCSYVAAGLFDATILDIPIVSRGCPPEQ
jgi:hypothetical protein